MSPRQSVTHGSWSGLVVEAWWKQLVGSQREAVCVVCSHWTEVAWILSKRSQFQLWVYKILCHEPKAFEMQIACLHAFANTQTTHHELSRWSHEMDLGETGSSSRQLLSCVVYIHAKSYTSNLENVSGCMDGKWKPCVLPFVGLWRNFNISLRKVG